METRKMAKHFLGLEKSWNLKNKDKIMEKLWHLKTKHGILFWGILGTDHGIMRMIPEKWNFPSGQDFAKNPVQMSDTFSKSH